MTPFFSELYRSLDTREQINEYGLYDLKENIGEYRNLADVYSEHVKQMKRDLLAFY